MTDETTPELALFDLMTGHRITAVLYAAARLGIADILAEGQRTATELAVATATHEPALLRLLRALVTIEICSQTGQEQFGLTHMGRHLSGNSPRSLKALAIFEGEMLRASWSGFLDTINTGKTGAQLAGAASSFELILWAATRGRLQPLTRLWAILPGWSPAMCSLPMTSHE